jgi:hypothetical protein
MPTPITLRHGISRPFAVVIETGGSGLDMGTVTAVSFRVRGAQHECEWPATLTPISSSKLSASKLVATSECPGPGQYQVTPLLTVTGQAWPSEAESFNLQVVQ